MNYSGAMFHTLQKGFIPVVLFGAILFVLYTYTYKINERNLVPLRSPRFSDDGKRKTNLGRLKEHEELKIPKKKGLSSADSDNGKMENDSFFKRETELEELTNQMTKGWSSTDPKTKSNVNLERVTNLDDLTKGKTKVLRFNGERFERLYEFCTWTLPFHCSMLKVPHGKIPIFHHDPAIDPMMGAKLAKYGIRDEKKIGIILGELEKEPEAMFLDLGANVGIYTLTIAKILKRRVIAVEPVIQNAAKLCKSIQENGLTDIVTLVFNPLSDQHTLVDMKKPPKHLSGSIVKPLSSLWVQEKNYPTCPKEPPYNTVCMDDLLPYMTSKTAVIKIDVESYEYNAFKGGRKFLDDIEVPAILMEWKHVKKKPHSDIFVEMLRYRSYVAYSTTGEVLNYRRYMTWPNDVLWRKYLL